jgi:hypothetical protein
MIQIHANDSNFDSVLLAFCGACVRMIPVYSQDPQEETLSRPDSHETGQRRQ